VQTHGRHSDTWPVCSVSSVPARPSPRRVPILFREKTLLSAIARRLWRLQVNFFSLPRQRVSCSLLLVPRRNAQRADTRHQPPAQLIRRLAHRAALSQASSCFAHCLVHRPHPAHPTTRGPAALRVSVSATERRTAQTGRPGLTGTGTGTSDWVVAVVVGTRSSHGSASLCSGQSPSLLTRARRRASAAARHRGWRRAGAAAHSPPRAARRSHPAGLRATKAS